MFKAKSSGSFKNTDAFLEKMKNQEWKRILKKHAVAGMDALSNASPEDTGLMASSWDYKIQERPGEVTISWYNNNIENGQVVAVLVQYGHGTRSGSYVQGRDFINPAMRPIFDKILDDVWNEVNK